MKDTLRSPPLDLIRADHLPGCRVWIERRFEDRVAINYAHSGRIWWAMGKNDLLELVGPVIWWTWPGPLFRYGVPAGDAGCWDHYYVSMRGAWVEDARKQGWFNTRTRTPFAFVRDANRCREEFDALVSEAARNDGLGASSRVLMLLRTARESSPDGAMGNPRTRNLHGLLDAIRREPQGAWSELEEARRMHVSAAHFRRLFRVEAGLPFHAFCLRARMERAASLLRGADLPLKAVALKCGVPDIYHFHRLFKRHLGETPARYREAARFRG